MIPLFIAGMLVWCSSVAVALERHLVFDQDTDVYKLKWNDARIAESQMRDIAALSPYVTFSSQFSVGISATKAPSGRTVIDKVFLAPELELCAEQPGKPCRRNPEKLDAAFLQNAERNLQEVEDQLQRLRTESLPAVLEPVRAYLLGQLQRSARRERSRYDYLKSGDVQPLRTLLCQECTCSQADETLLQRLQTESDPDKRLELSRFEWANRALQCQSQRHRASYPVEVWRRFIKDFGISESRSWKHIE